MDRLIGIDFGRKRTGVAASDPLGIFASALDTVDSTKIIEYLQNYAASETITRFVVGWPTNMDGTPSEAAADVEAFQKGWTKSSTSENNALTITLTCKSFFIIYLAGNPQVKGDPKGNYIANYQNKAESSDKGELKWAADMTCKQSNASTIVNNGNGWENPCCIILIDKENAATYDISIKMENAGDPGILLAFGYCA